MVSKKRKVFRGHLRAVAIGDRFLDAALHLLRLAAQHGGLIGHADRSQVNIGIKPGRVSAAELVQESLLVAAVPDVIANVIGVGQGQNHEVMAFAITEGARAGGLGFFVLGLAVNDRGGRFAGVFAHALPDAHDVAAGGVDDLATAHP